MNFKVEYMMYNENNGNIGFVLIDADGTKYNWIDIHKNELGELDKELVPPDHPWLEIKELIGKRKH